MCMASTAQMFSACLVSHSRNNPTYFVCNISNCLFYFVDPHSSHFGMTIPGGRMPPVSHGVRLGLVYDPKPHSPSAYHSRQSSIAEYLLIVFVCINNSSLSWLLILVHISSIHISCQSFGLLQKKPKVVEEYQFKHFILVRQLCLDFRSCNIFFCGAEMLTLPRQPFDAFYLPSTCIFRVWVDG